MHTETSTDDLLSQFRVGLGKVGIWAFHKVYRETVDGMKYADGGQWMWNLCAWLDEAHKPSGYIVGAVPREHMKTSIGTTTAVARAVCYRFKYNIVLIAKNQKEATDKMRNIVDGVLERNPRIVRDFGFKVQPAMDAQGKNVTYNNREVILANGCRMAAMQLCGPIRGQNKDDRRVDLLVFDDPEDDQTVLNVELRDKQYDWLFSACLNSMSRNNGSLVWLGTILHDDSLLSRQIRDMGTPLKFKLPAYDVHTLDPLWPEYWSYDALMAKKKTLNNNRLFSQEYMNTPIASEDQAYKPEYWKFYDRTDLREEAGRYHLPHPDDPERMMPLNVIMAVDPAISQTKDADWFAYMVMAWMEGAPYKFVLEIYRAKITFGEQLMAISSAVKRWRVMRAIIEAQGYQGVLSEQAWNVGVPSVPIKHHTGKVARNTAAAAYYEHGEVYLPRDGTNVDLFCEEAESFPLGAHDDMLDTSTMCLDEIAHHSVRHRIDTADRRRNMHVLSSGFVTGSKITAGY